MGGPSFKQLNLGQFLKLRWKLPHQPSSCFGQRPPVSQNFGLGLHPETECFPLGLMASRKGQADSGRGVERVDRTLTFCKVPNVVIIKR